MRLLAVFIPTKTSLLARALFLALVIATAVVTSILATAAAAQDDSALAYRIGSRDKVQIRVEELPNLNSDQEVAEDGTITLPVIGTVEAQGLNEGELAARLRSRLEAEGLRRATVSVKVTAYRSRPVTIVGAIGNPGNHYVPGRGSLLEVLMNAGGLTRGHGHEIFVRRHSDNGLSDQVTVPVRDLIERGDPAVNIPIFAGDLIHVPPARQVTIHFLGQVGAPGSQTFEGDERVTLLTAVARVGGLAATASKKVRIRRQGGDDEIVADYRRILDGKDPDIELEDGDIVIVKEAFF